MQALVQSGLGTTTERFASPLNFNPTSECYFSLYQKTGFLKQTWMHVAANWHRSLGSNPDHEPAEMEKTLRWAIFSARL